MLTCRHVAKQADDWLDGELSQRQSLRIKMHLAMCRGCRRFMEQMRITRRLTAQGGIAEGKTDMTPRALSTTDSQRIGAIFAKLHEDDKPGE